MVKRIGTARRKTRHKLSRSVKEKGRVNVNAFMQSFKKGEKVVLKADPGYQRGMYHPRYHGRPAIVAKKQGECYIVTLKDGSKGKNLLVHPRL